MDVYIIAAPVCQPKSIRGVRFRSDEGDVTRSTVTCTSSYGFSLQAEASEREGRSREAAAADVDPDVSPTHGRRKVSARCAPDLDPMDILSPLPASSLGYLPLLISPRSKSDLTVD